MYPKNSVLARLTVRQKTEIPLRFRDKWLQAVTKARELPVRAVWPRENDGAGSARLVGVCEAAFYADTGGVHSSRHRPRVLKPEAGRGIFAYPKPWRRFLLGRQTCARVCGAITFRTITHGCCLSNGTVAALSREGMFCASRKTPEESTKCFLLRAAVPFGLSPKRHQKRFFPSIRRPRRMNHPLPTGCDRLRLRR